MIALVTALVFIAVFLAAAVAVVIAAALMAGRTLSLAGVGEGAPDGSEAMPMLLREEPMSSISVWHDFLNKVDLIHILKKNLAEADLKWSAGRVTAAMLLAGAVGCAGALSVSWIPLPVALILGAGASLAPYLLILGRRSRRFQRIDEQMPDALDSLTRAMRAGHTFASAMDLVARETVAPLGPELKKACDEYRLGLPWVQVLDGLAGRLPMIEFRMFAASVTLQMRTGGKLSELFEKIAETIRESIALRGDVQAISSQSRLTGTILTIMPFGLALIMLWMNPEYLNILFTHPKGPPLVAGALVCLVLGHLVIRRIVTVRS